MRRFLCALLALSSLGQMARAEDLPPFYVLSGGPPESAAECGYTHASIAAVVKSELRHNRIEIVTDTTGNEIWAYIETVAVDGAGYNLCAVTFRLSLVVPQTVEVWATKEWRSVKMEFCKRWAVMTAPVADVQTTLNNHFRDFTSQCITEYLENQGLNFVN